MQKWILGLLVSAILVGCGSASTEDMPGVSMDSELKKAQEAAKVEPDDTGKRSMRKVPGHSSGQ